MLFDRSGELVATYRKIHLFDADPPGAVPSRESSVFSAGDQVVTAETEFGRVGLSICYDLRFPELYRALAVQGATILFVPAAFRFETGVDHWEPLLRARAIEVGVTFAELDLARVEQVRQILPSLRHRRLQPSCKSLPMVRWNRS